MRDQANRFKATTILIEDKSSGAQLIQELRYDGLHAVTRYEPKLEKVMRLHSVTSTIENGFVHLPDKAEWLAEYIHEITSFPNGKFDDQCDSTSQALDWIKSGSKYDGFFKWLESEADKAKKGAFGANHYCRHVQHARANRYQALVHNSSSADFFDDLQTVVLGQISCVSEVVRF